MTRAAFALALAVATCAIPASAEEPKLIFAVHAPPTAHLNARFFIPWVERVNAAGKGVLNIDARWGTGITTGVNFYDRILADVVQMSWGTVGAMSGNFALTQVVTLPFVSEDGETGSIAFWRLTKTGLLDAEYRDVHLILVNAYPQYGLHLVRVPSKPVQDLKGMRLIATQKSFGDVSEALGSAVISVPLADVYSALQRRTADGLITQWTAFQPYKFEEVLNYHVDGNLGSGTGAFMINKKRYDALPEAARKVLDDHSGELESRTFGKFWDTVADEAREATRKLPGHKIDKLSPEIEASWTKITKPLVDEWAQTTPGGERVLSTFRQLVVEAKRVTATTPIADVPGGPTKK